MNNQNYIYLSNMNVSEGCSFVLYCFLLFCLLLFSCIEYSFLLNLQRIIDTSAI